MKKKIINTLKSIGLILLILTFSSFMFVLLNIDVNSISDVKYLFYLSIFDLLLLIIYFFIYKDTIIKDFKKYFSDFNKNFLYINKEIMCHRIHEESETSNLIQNNIRLEEDYEMFKKFWPKGIAKFIMHFYKKAIKTNS